MEVVKLSDIKTDMDGVLIIPNGVKFISARSYKSRLDIKKVIIPSTVVGIDEHAFNGCLYLEEVVFGNNSKCTYIADYAFANCYLLKKIELPNTVGDLGKSAFRTCEALEKVVFSNNIWTIEESTFENCISLRSITNVEGVYDIEKKAFAMCRNLSIDLCEFVSLSKIGEEAFSSSGIKKVRIGKSLEAISKRAFEYCSKLEEVYFMARGELPEDCFAGCKSIKNICLSKHSSCGNLENYFDESVLENVTIV